MRTPAPSLAWWMSVLASSLLAAAVQVHAASEADYAGTWTASVQAKEETGPPLDVKVTLQGAAGTWFAYVGRRLPKYARCLGREMPLEVQESSPEALVFRVVGSRVISDCPDFTVRLRPVDAKTLEGTLGQNRTIRMTR